MREAQRVRLSTGPRRWTARELRLPGRFTDAELARRPRHNEAVPEGRTDIRRSAAMLPSCDQNAYDSPI